MTNQQPKAIFIMGPTASGKTALAAELFKQLECEIISVDSAMIYRGMNIGTATPTDEEQQRVPHHLVNILDPADVYSAARFRHDALEKMASAIRRKKTPVLVGGTMLYFKSLLKGLSPLPKADVKTRQAIAAAAQEKGWEALHCDLKAIDPTSAARIHPNDPQRLSRALEVFYVSGKTLTELTSQTGDKLTYNVHQFAVAPDGRCVLHQRITQRFQTMLEQGLETEVRSLFERGDLHPDLPSIRCVGYRQMWDYLEGKLGFQEMKYRAIVATRQLAKRQMTWLKNWDNLTWLNTEASCNINLVLQSIGCR